MIGLIVGIRLKRAALKKLHIVNIIKKPEKTPALKGRLFLNPYLPALDMAIILLGPGVKVVTITYEIKAIIFGIDIPPLLLLSRHHILIILQTVNGFQYSIIIHDIIYLNKICNLGGKSMGFGKLPWYKRVPP